MKIVSWSLVVCFTLSLLLAAPAVRAAEGPVAEWANFLNTMQAQGWEQIASGVFQRKMGGNKTETVTYGRKGLTWMVNHQGERLSALQREYRRFPTADLANAIAELSALIAKTKSELPNVPSTLTQQVASVAGGPCSSICYSATADAYPQTSVQGVGAIADATFNSSCGYTGDTFAYAFARATSGITTTAITQQDPKSGNPINSHAVAAVNGGSITGTPCKSDATAWVVSSALGISYSTTDTNTQCPVVVTPVSVTISGTSFEYFTNYTCRSVTWTAAVSGGSGSYTAYNWTIDGFYVGGNGASLTYTICGGDASFTVGLTVTDTANGTGFDSHFVDVWFEPPFGCLREPCPLPY